jgi:ATP-dependent exoDNAse (exonuclease V) beta subunit
VSAARHELILASAGTGKTWRLTNRFLALLFAGVEPERILATTFTRKAAGEILDRVLERLVQASESEAQRAQLSRDLQLEGLDLERCRGLLSDVTRHLNAFHVRTIDSFFVHLVRLFALDLELPPDWRICDDRVDELLRSEALQEVLAQEADDELLVLLRELANGGCGRSVHEALLRRIGEMRPAHLESSPQAWECFDTGTDVDDEEFAAALAAIEAAPLPVTAKGKPDSRWLKARNTLLDRGREGLWEELIVDGLGKVFYSEERLYYGKPLPLELELGMTPVVRRARHRLLSELRTRNLAGRGLLETFERVYEARKRSEGAYRFDDLPHLLAPRTAAALPLDERELDLWFRLDGKIDHLLLDEFQDTSPVQWRILQPIAAEIVAQAAGARSFFCVGDVKQSIYSFRQAEPRLLAELHEMLPGLEPEPMFRSYRSSQVVLDTVNFVFEELVQNPVFAVQDVSAYEPALAHWAEGFPRHVAAREDLPGAAFMVEARPKGEDESSFAPLLERTVERVVGLREEAPEATIAILTRKRRWIPQLIHRLRKQGIDARGEGGNELTDARAVLAYISLLHLADFPGDTAAAFHVATSPFGTYVGLPIDAKDVERGVLARQLRLDLADLQLGEFTRRLAVQVAADPSWTAWDKARFAQLLDLAHAFESNGEGRTSAFVDHLRSQRVEAPGGAGVRVMTIHGSKGLEFDAVVLPELGGGFADVRDRLLVDRPRPQELIQRLTFAPRKDWLPLSPELRELYDKLTVRMVEDSLCVLYVAMTRAARRLELIVPCKEPGKSFNIPKLHHFLRAALASRGLHEPDGEGVLWAHEGNAAAGAWARGLVAEGVSEPTAPPPPLELAPRRRVRSSPRRSPSGEEGGGRRTATEALRSAAGADVGTLVHACLERLEWLEDFELDLETLAQPPLLRRAEAGLRATALELVARGLSSPPVRQALSRAACLAPEGSELEVRPEERFSLLLPSEGGQEELWSGSIDRLVLARQDGRVIWAEVIDYKTDRPTEQSLDALVRHYEPQLTRYVQFVSERYDLAPGSVHARLVFLGAGEVRSLNREVAK